MLYKFVIIYFVNAKHLRTQNSKEYFDEIGGTYSIDGIVVPLLNTAKSLLITCIYMVVTKL